MFGKWKKKKIISCFRCNTALEPREVLKDERGYVISFFFCPGCGSKYAKKDNGEIHDRWMMPLSVVLYPTIFSVEPVLVASRVASHLEMYKNEGEIRRIVEHIEDELANPKQKVKEILDSAADEQELRAYLRAVMDFLNRKRCPPDGCVD